MTSSESISVEIWRGGKHGDFKTYAVPRMKLQTILDCVTYVQRKLDPHLSYRYSCRVGVCGTCAMMVNGVPRWTCRTQASNFSRHRRIRIAPLANFPVIKDLVVDMEPLFEKWMAAGGAFTPSGSDHGDFAAIEPGSASRKAVDDAIECIGCGICHAACDVVSWNPDYAGPAALNRAWTLLNDERASISSRSLDAVMSDSGCFSCHTTRSCTRHCPKHLDPSSSIAGLKSKALRQDFPVSS